MKAVDDTGPIQFEKSEVSLALDSSVTLARILSDETTAAVERVFDLVSEGGAWVPGLWRLEVANALEVGVRRGRYTADFRDRTLVDLSSLTIWIDPESDRQAWGATLRLAERHRLTLYDAAYLELALRRGLPLATLDRELRAAATGEKIRLLGL
jgi:predicted nucleic acid-binding protein